MNILHRATGVELYASLKAQSMRELVEEADLRGVNLSGADLSGANLRWADLSGANLRWANLRWADLSGANLRWANLSEANLREANLSGANLSGADLRGANLSEANLRGANLSEALVGGPDFLAPAQWSCFAIPGLASRIAQVALGNGALDMHSWHTCDDTTRRLAGWAVHLAGPAGYALEAVTSPTVAGAMLCPEAAHLFYADSETAKAWLREQLEAK